MHLFFFFADIPRFPVIEHDKPRQDRVPPTGQLFHRRQRNPGIWSQSPLTPRLILFQLECDLLTYCWRPTSSYLLNLLLRIFLLFWFLLAREYSRLRPVFILERPDKSPKDFVWPVNLAKRKLCFSHAPLLCQVYMRTRACLNPIKEIVVLM